MCFEINGLKNLKLTILRFFAWSPEVYILLYSSKNIFIVKISVALYIKNLLKQLSFYGQTIKLRIKKLITNAKLLSELPFFKKPKKVKIKQLTTKKLLQEQPFYKQPIKNHVLKN